MDTFNEKLKQLRQETAQSQQYVANAVGITRSAYANYEQGLREPDLATLKKLCIYFGVSADYLLGIDN